MQRGEMEQFDGFEYNTRDMIGQGAFAAVYKGRYIDRPDMPVAIKSILKKNLSKTKNLLTKEIKILKELSNLKHKNLVSLLKCTETDSRVYLVIEYCDGGDLGDYLQRKTTLAEDTIHHFAFQIANAMEAIFNKGIVHRDLKPQNILLCNPPKKHNPPPNELVVKLADFGFARFLGEGVMAATLCGSPLYMAPEVIMSHQYDAKADLWSIGTILFQCLTGKPPFRAQTPQELKALYEKSRDLRPVYPDWCSVSPCLKDLLSKLLKRNAQDRMGFKEFFAHPFLHEPPAPSPSKRILEAASPLSARRGPGGSGLPVPRRTPGKMENPQPPQRRTAPLAPAMGESEDFTFLPPLQQKPEHSPVKQVQVHTADSHVGGTKAVPVPSQRVNYTKIEERRSGLGQGASRLASPRSPLSQRATAKPITNVENINLPQTQYLVRGTGARRSLAEGRQRRTPSTTQDEPTMLPGQVPHGVERIPKSETTTDLGARARAATAGGTTTGTSAPLDNVRFLTASPPKTRRELPAPIHSDVSEDEDEVMPPPLNLPFGRPESSGAMMESGASADDTTSSSSDPVASRTGNKTLDDKTVNNFTQGSGLPSRAPPLFERRLEEEDDEPPPALEQETVLQEGHKQVLAKLRFVVELVDTLMNVAEQSEKPLVAAMANRKNEPSSTYRRAEQLVVYVRALHMLSSALLLAQRNVASQVLHPSPAVQNVLNALNDKYHQCLVRSQELASQGLPGQDPTMAVISAERVMYKHAIDLCQTAALDELFGNPQMCSQRYQTAYIMLHTLSEQVQNEQDKSVLSRYKNAVEKRLRILERQGYVTAVST